MEPVIESGIANRQLKSNEIHQDKDSFLNFNRQLNEMENVRVQATAAFAFG